MKEVVVLTWILYCFLDHLCLPKLRNLFSLRHGCKDELTTNPSMTHPTTRAGCRLHSIVRLRVMGDAASWLPSTSGWLGSQPE
jgi:hypothetical protein